jgi:hypothetical protein
VWGGFEEERLFKTSTTTWEDDDEAVLVDPKCSLRLSRNRLCGRVWAGQVRPLHLEEEGNIYEEGGDKMEEMTEEEPDQEGLESLVYVEDKAGAKVPWPAYLHHLIREFAPSTRRSASFLSLFLLSLSLSLSLSLLLFNLVLL